MQSYALIWIKLSADIWSRLGQLAERRIIFAYSGLNRILRGVSEQHANVEVILQNGWVECAIKMHIAGSTPQTGAIGVISGPAG